MTHTALRAGRAAEVRDARSACSARRQDPKRKALQAHRQSRHRRLGPRPAPARRRLRRRRARRALRRQRRSARARARARGRRRRTSTLFVVASKTFTTQETMAQRRRAARGRGCKTFLSPSPRTPRRRRQFGAAEVLPMSDWVGGRYSVWSAVGLRRPAAPSAPPRSTSSSPARARSTSTSATRRSRSNVPALMALLGVWNSNFLGATTHAVLPYSHRAAPAARLPAAAGDGIERQARRPRGPRGRLRDRAGAVGRRRHAEPARLPPAAAPGHAGRAGRLHRRSRRTRRCRPTRARRPTRSRSAPATPTLPPHRRYPGNRPSQHPAVQELHAARTWAG